MQKIAWNKELLNAQEENLLFPDEPCICINKTKFSTGSQHADIMKQFVLFPFNLNFVFTRFCVLLHHWSYNLK